MPPRLIVCTSCRDDADRASDRADGRAGARLLDLLRSVAPCHIEIAAHICLSGCKRSCAFALQGTGRWTYVFGDCAADLSSVNDISACVRLYLARPDGFMERRDRPLRLQNGVLARVPPLEMMSAD